jgi:hypothetical protein
MSSYGFIPRGIGLLAMLILSTVPTFAQGLPTLTMTDASITEGNFNTVNLTFTASLSRVSANTTSARVTAIPLTGSSFNPAVGGIACGAGVDFLAPVNMTISIPANANPPSRTFTIPVCGDLAQEPNEHIFVALSEVTNAQCLEGTCNGIGTILTDKDTGPSQLRPRRPALNIGDVTVREPAPSLGSVQTGSIIANFTVTLTQTTQQNVTVAYATRVGTAASAKNGGIFQVPKSCGLGAGDYVTRSGVVTISAGHISGTIPISVCSDSARESDETFFVDLSAPTNATIADGTAQGTIRNTNPPGL